MSAGYPRVLIPVNQFDRAKGRLASLLDAGVREALAIATLRTVVTAARAANLPVTLLTSEPRVVDLGLDAEIVAEQPGLAGLTPQLQAFVDGSDEDELLILHADLPRATAGSLVALACSGARQPSVTAVRSIDGGTNAMLLREAKALRLAYGPDSFQLHTEAARRAGLRFARHFDSSLALDLDTPGDIRELLRSESGRATLAGRLLASAKIDP
jgi:2-phospho-L-lactate guanylyltransferase